MKQLDGKCDEAVALLVGFTMAVIAIGTFLRPAIEADRVKWRE